MKVLFKFTLLLSLLIPVLAFAQDKDEQLAAQYFSNGEFDKAIGLYQKLYSRKPDDGYLYENLLKCHFALKQFDDAEKLVKRAQKRNRQSPAYGVDLGYVLRESGNNTESVKVFNQLIKDMPPDAIYAEDLSRSFQKRNEFGFAAETYLKYRKLIKNDVVFAPELAQLFAQQNKPEEMIREFLNFLSVDDSKLTEVEEFLGFYLDNNVAGSDLLKKTLLKRMQEESGKEVFGDLLVWLLLQRQELDAALAQCKAIDKRFKLNGKKLFELGELVKLTQPELALKAYQAVVAMGEENNPFMLSARYSILEIRSRKLFEGNYTQADLLALEQDYYANIKSLGMNYLSASFIRDLAHLQGFYLHKHDSAIILLKELSAMPRINPQQRARAKLELGDVYVFTNDVWEATLMYEQVDYDFKEDPIGQEAKFKNAKLSYYRGDFEWAQAQLDVLKTATSQLISNNALELALLIQDNTPDSNTDALVVFAHADLLIYQNKANEAMIVLDTLEKQFPNHPLADEILYARGMVWLQKREFSKALIYLEQVWKQYNRDILSDNALITCARIYENNLGDKEKAATLYEKFITDYPSSLFITEARARFRTLRGDKLSQ